ncbi:MAG: peptide chain release factor N(5)-glutamine methyltransferase, partial [Ferruginibacter sp.]
MTIRELYRDYIQQLKQVYDAGEATEITNRVFETVAGIARFDIVKHPQQVADASISAQLHHCLSALLQHNPVQYVLGEAWFYKMKLKVSDQVLIPRSETEELVQLVIDDYCPHVERKPLSKSDWQLPCQDISMLDIGTGSGCIAIAIKKNLPAASISAIDVSEAALAVAIENAGQQQASIHFLQLDFLNENNWNDLSIFDVIISNPPYIPLNERSKLEKNATAFEPPAALFVPDNAPLIFYEKIAAFGKGHLTKTGRIYVEINEDLAKETKEVFDHFYLVEIKKDIFGKERMLVITPKD